MTTALLTDIPIKALEPTGSKRDFRGTALQDLDVRTMPSGRKRFFAHTQSERKGIWKTIGDPDKRRLNESRSSERAALATVR